MLSLAQPRMSNNKQLVEMLPAQYSFIVWIVGTVNYGLGRTPPQLLAVNAEYHRMPRTAIYLYCASPMHPKPRLYTQHLKHKKGERNGMMYANE